MLLGRVAVLVPLLLLFTASTHAEEEEFARHSVGGFVGVTGESRRENGLTLGLVYEWRAKESFSLAIEVERVSGDLDFWVATLPLIWHVNQWKFFAGPGIEKPDDGDSEALFRVGGEYGFEIGRWELSPGLALDFVDSETEMIIGVGLLYGF